MTVKKTEWMVRLFAVLAVALPAVTQAYRPKGLVKKNYCPPLGPSGTHYEITVLSAASRSLGGCVVPRAYWKNGDFEMWLDEGGSCKGNEMNYYHFNCLSTWKFSEAESSNWTYVLLQDTSIVDSSSRRPLRCAVYKIFDKGSKVIMAMSGEDLQSGSGCNDAAMFVNLPENEWDTVASSMPNRPILLRLDRTDTEPDYDHKPMIVRQHNPLYDDKLYRKRRSPVDEPDFSGNMENTCRFPEFAQGQWSNLRIDGGAIRYVYVSSPEDFDNDGNNNDSENQGEEGEDGDAELLMRRRNRRDLGSSELKQTMEAITQSIPLLPNNFNVEEFVNKYNLTNFPIDRLDAVFINLFKLINATIAKNNESEPSVSPNTPSPMQHSISPFDDNDDERTNNYEPNILGPRGVDGEEVVRMNSRIRREINADLLQTIETIMNSVSLIHKHFDVEGFIGHHNLTDFPMENLNALIVNLYKPIENSTANNKDSLPVSSKTPSRKQRSISSYDNNGEDAQKINRYRKIARIERIWDEELRDDIQRAFETFDYYGFPEKIHHSIKKTTSQTKSVTSYDLEKPILEAWDSFISLFGFAKNNNQPIFPPTPPSSPPPTPPNTPPRSSVVTDDQPFGTQIGSLLDEQQDNQNNYVKYSHENSNPEPTKRKKRCVWNSPSTAKPPSSSNPLSGEFSDHNKDQTLDTIDKYNKEHDPLNNDQGQGRKAAGIPILMMDQASNKNVQTTHKRETTDQPNAFGKMFYAIGDFFKGKKPEPARPKSPVVVEYSLDFKDEELNRRKRSADSDDYEEQVTLEYAEMKEEITRAHIIEEERSQKFMSWWTNYRNTKMDEYRKEYNLSDLLNEVDYLEYPEMRPMPTAVEFLETARSLGVPNKVALNQWRTLAREHRLWLAELEFVAFPGQNHPDVSLGDFDHTYEDIELEFDPEHPEGTAEDPSAYRVYTIPGGGPRIGSRLTRRSEWERKRHLGTAKQSVSDTDDDYVSDAGNLNANDIREMYSMYPSGSVLPYGLRTKVDVMVDGTRTRRSAGVRPSPTPEPTPTPEKFAWRCVQPTQDPDDSMTIGTKFLTMGGRIYDEETGPAVSSPDGDDKITGGINFEQVYGCLWLVSRGPNVIEFSILATGMPRPGQDMKSFAQELCTESQTRGRDSSVRSKNKLRPRRRWWFTETRPEEKNRVQVSCPVPPGTVFYGVVPAPPLPQSSDPLHATPSSSSLQLCARLVSAADDCQQGEAGRADRMKYTVSECVEQQMTTDGSLPAEVINTPKPQDVFEERSYQCLGQWTELQQNGPDEASAMLTYTFVKRMDANNPGAPDYECFVGTTVANDPGRDPATTTTLMLTEAGTGNRCSRLADPFKSGMKLIGTKIGQGTACAGKGGSGPTNPTGGSWYPMQPKELPSGGNQGTGKLAMPNPSTVPSVSAGSSTWNPAKKDKEPVFVRPAPQPKENGAVVFKSPAVAIVAAMAYFFVF